MVKLWIKLSGLISIVCVSIVSSNLDTVLFFSKPYTFMAAIYCAIRLAMILHKVLSNRSDGNSIWHINEKWIVIHNPLDNNVGVPFIFNLSSWYSVFSWMAQAAQIYCFFYSASMLFVELNMWYEWGQLYLYLLTMILKVIIKNKSIALDKLVRVYWLSYWSLKWKFVMTDSERCLTTADLRP